MKVIIITRDGEYDNSKALEYYSKGLAIDWSYLKEHIHYVFKDALIFDGSQTFSTLSREPLISSKELEVLDNDSGTNWEDVYKDRIREKVDEYLKPNLPYVRLDIEDKEIYFVFLNRMLGKFINQNSSMRFTSEVKLYRFIKAICQDCEILDETGNLKTADGGNYLYIHDKEWGCDGEKLVKFGNDWREDITNAKLKELLEKCFSKIIVFQHTSSSYHKSIKDLTFTSAVDIEDIILKRGYF